MAAWGGLMPVGLARHQLTSRHIQSDTLRPCIDGASALRLARPARGVARKCLQRVTVRAQGLHSAKIRSDDRLPPLQFTSMAIAPFAAASLRFTDGKKSDDSEESESSSALKESVEKGLSLARKVYDRIYYGDVLPPVGSVRMSYARFLDLLNQKRVKRMTILGDGAVAIVEVPVEGWASETNDVKHDRRNPEIMYAKQRPEWQMEKHRFYVDLPGDFWESGVVMRKIKENLPHRTADGRLEYAWLLQEGQVTPELKVIDPTDQLVWLNQYAGQFVPIFGLIFLRMILGALQWLADKVGKKKKDRMQEIADQYAKSPAKSFNVKDEKGVEKKGTGVRFADVAGIDAVKNDIQEILQMMLGNERYLEMGARMPRGILLEGPPGTGKTYLAKAMAGEAGIPFFSANGAEFVEMFQGVAAARVRNLFKTARKYAPAIVFIDEIDAIGKRRGDGQGDSGTSEREQGLLQLLQEMDGFTRMDQVLVIGATNRMSALDDALLRPGRFDRAIFMGMPSRSNRLKILEVHSKNKPVSRAPSEKWPEGNALLNDLADLTIGYSGAELANLLNESAILAVRRDKKEIDYETALAAMEKYRLGLEQPPIPDSPAKQQMAHAHAGRAVLSALTLGMPPIEQVSIQPRGGQVARILFMPQETGKYGNEWHKLGYGVKTINAVEPQPPPGCYDFLKGLLVPLYAARATEEIIYGKRGVTLSTAREVSRAGDLAHWLVRSSMLHPAFREHAINYSMIIAGEKETITEDMATAFEGFTLQLQKEAYATAKRLVRERLPVIKSVAEQLCSRTSGTISGKDIIDMMKATPLENGGEPESREERITHAKVAANSNAVGKSGSVSFRGRNGVVSFHHLVGEPKGSTHAQIASNAYAAGKSGSASFRSRNGIVSFHHLVGKPESLEEGGTRAKISLNAYAAGRSGSVFFRSRNGMVSFHRLVNSDAIYDGFKRDIQVVPSVLSDAIDVLRGQLSDDPLLGVGRNGSQPSVSSNRTGKQSAWENSEDFERNLQVAKFATDISQTYPSAPRLPYLSRKFVRNSGLYEWATLSRVAKKDEDAEVEVIHV